MLPRLRERCQSARAGLGYEDQVWRLLVQDQSAAMLVYAAGLDAVGVAAQHRVDDRRGSIVIEPAAGSLRIISDSAERVTTSVPQFEVPPPDAASV